MKKTVYEYLYTFLLKYFFLIMKAEHICCRVPEMCREVQ